MVARLFILFMILFVSFSVIAEDTCPRAKRVTQFIIKDADLWSWSAQNGAEIGSAVSGQGMITCADAMKDNNWYLYKDKCARKALEPLCKKECLAKSRCMYKTYRNDKHCECGGEISLPDPDDDVLNPPVGQNGGACLGVVPDGNVLDQVAEYTMSTTEHLIRCDKKMLKEYQQSSKDQRKFKRKLKRQCRKKAKEYKRALLKNLMKEKKFGQAFKVLFKRKRSHLEKVKNDKNKSSVVLPDSFEEMNEDQLLAHIMGELEKDYPGLQEQAVNLMNKDPKYKLGFHQYEAAATNIIIKPKRGGAPCKVDIHDFPEEEPFTPFACKTCYPDAKDYHFAPDCSIMLPKDGSMSKEQAYSLMGKDIGEKDADGSDVLCNQPNMNGDNLSDMSHMDNTAKEICSMAQKGLTPDFTIETARNQYNDETDNLAQKRGEFIQKYIFEKLKGCDADAAWLPTEDQKSGGANEEAFKSFSDLVKVKHPWYAGGKEGNYGPNPRASKSEQEQEVENLVVTLNKERVEIDAELLQLDEKINFLTESIKQFDANAVQAKETYDKYITKLHKEKDLKEIEKLHHEIHQGVGQTLDQYQNKHDMQQQLVNFKKEREVLLKKKQEKYTTDKIDGKKKMLEEYYRVLNDYRADGKVGPGEEIPRHLRKVSTGSGIKNIDDGLFTDFKMVRIKGRADVVEPVSSEFDYMPPKLQVMMNLVTDVQQQACVVEPIETKKGSLKGFAKGILQVGAVLTLPFGAAIAAGGVATLGVFNSLTCFGCGDPGRQVPEWRKIGNVWAIGPKSVRKQFWKDLGSGIKNYVSADWAIDTESHKRIYSDFDKYAKGYYGENYANKTLADGQKLTEKELPVHTSRWSQTATKAYYDDSGNVRATTEIVEFTNSKKMKPKFNEKELKKQTKGQNQTYDVSYKNGKPAQVIIKDVNGNILEVRDYEKNVVTTNTRYNAFGDEVYDY
jgi:hypothetical protein